MFCEAWQWRPSQDGHGEELRAGDQCTTWPGLGLPVLFSCDRKPLQEHGSVGEDGEEVPAAPRAGNDSGLDWGW